MECVSVIKVLRGMHSLFDRGDFSLEYRPQQWIYPSVGKIYAFQDYESALTWARDYPGTALWEAYAEIFSTGHSMFCTNAYCDLWVFWRFYSLFARGELFVFPPWTGATSAPNGTVLCNGLMITRKLRDL